MFTSLKRIIRRKVAKLFGFWRPTSSPYLSGDSFRALAQHFFDESFDLEVDKIEEGEIVYVRAGLLKDFFQKVHPKIKNRYILISHNEDVNINKELASYADEKIIFWFAQNVEYKTEKIIPIPIGLTNRHYDTAGNPSLFDLLRRDKPAEKIMKIFYSFAVGSCPEDRGNALKNLQESNVSESFNPETFSDYKNYFKKLKNYAFVASPFGRGIDCCRTWEALYFEVIPIVRRTPMSEFFFQIGLPLLIIENWNEIKEMNADFLKNKYLELKDRFQNAEALWMHFWQKLIDEKRNK